MTVHTGSRSLGAIVSRHHEKIAKGLPKKKARTQLLTSLKSAGNFGIIQDELQRFEREWVEIEGGLDYLEGEELLDYLNDLVIAQDFALNSRVRILERVLENLNGVVGYQIKPVDLIDSTHNYLSIEEGIIRKGATSARKGERLLIPINMRDGILIGVGKGNKDWNYSAPHGAGRVMSRKADFENISLDEYKESMKNVYSTTVVAETVDESPMVYKPIDEIIENTKDTMDLVDVIKPVYSFKGA